MALKRVSIERLDSLIFSFVLFHISGKAKPLLVSKNPITSRIFNKTFYGKVNYDILARSPRIRRSWVQSCVPSVLLYDNKLFKCSASACPTILKNVLDKMNLGLGAKSGLNEHPSDKKLST